MLSERIEILRSAGTILSNPDTSPTALIESADQSASRLVNILTSTIDSFNDVHSFSSREVKIHKRAQILVADLWAAFNGTSFGSFDDIHTLTMFADYRVPQMLHSLGCLWYSPRLEGKIKRKEAIESGETKELEVRGCSIWCVELLRREIERRFGGEMEVEAADEGDDRKVKMKVKVNAVLIDFLLYDVAKEWEKESEGEADDGEGKQKFEEGEKGFRLPHHRTRSIWY
jgi:hypothetical protein